MTIAGIGHNRGALPLFEQLTEDHVQLRLEVDVIVAKATAAPHQITSDADLDAVAKIVTSARALSRKIDDQRIVAKEQFLSSGRVVDTFFKTMTDRLKRMESTFQDIADGHARKLAVEVRRRADENARRARAEEDERLAMARKAAEAERPAHAAQHIARAEEAAQRATKAETISSARSADIVGTRTESGISASAKDKWEFEITDYDAITFNGLLRPYFHRDHVIQAIRLAVKQGVRELSGVRIYQDVKARFR